MNNELLYYQARTWLGTKFCHQGRLKKSESSDGGVDCLGLLIGISRELGIKSRTSALLESYDSKAYGKVPDGKQLKYELCNHLIRIEPEDILCGDILLFCFDNNPQHLAIAGRLAERIMLIHSYSEVGKVVENGFEEPWLSRFDSAYRVSEF